jgi:hypothetical protein
MDWLVFKRDLSFNRPQSEFLSLGQAYCLSSEMANSPAQSTIDLMTSFSPEEKIKAPATPIAAPPSDRESMHLVRVHEALQRATSIVLAHDPRVPETYTLVVKPRPEDWTLILGTIGFGSFKSIELKPDLGIVIYHDLLQSSQIYMACVQHTSPLWMLPFLGQS